MGQVKYTVRKAVTPHNAEGFDDIRLITPTKFYDERGYFEELYNIDELRGENILQISRSVNKKYVFRGMHYQQSPEMNKIMHVRKGSATLFAVDTRIGADRRPHILFLSERDNGYLYAPWWYARGFLTHEDDTEILYFQTETVSQFARAFNYKAVPDLAKYLEFWEPMMTISEKDRNASMFIS